MNEIKSSSAKRTWSEAGNYAIYLRKSRRDILAEAAGDAETLERHLETLRALAKKMNLNVTRVYAEVVSGESIESRPQMQALLRDVETGIYDGVLVVEVERLARGDTSDQGRVAKTFKFSNTKIITPAKIYDPNNEFDEEYFEFGLFMSRREYQAIRRRLIAGMSASCREGKYTGNKPPFGYHRKKLKGEKGWTLEVAPDQAAVVRMIFDWYVNGLNAEKVGFSKIAYELNRLNLPSPSGNPWTRYGVQGILRNPVYAGYIKDGYRKEVKKIIDGKTVRSRPVNHDAQLYPGRHQAIISQDVWEAASSAFQKRLKSSDNRVHPMQNPLSGLVVCSCCHKTMVRRPYNNGAPAGLICTSPGCPTVSSYLHMVEQRVLDALDEWLLSAELPGPEALPDNSAKISVLESGIQSCQIDLDEVNGQIDKQYDLLERGIYTEEVFFNRNAQMRKRRDELKTQLNDLISELEKESSRGTAIRNLLPTLRTIHDVYHTLTSPVEKNNLLKEVIDHIEYTKTDGGRHGRSDSFVLEIFPRVSEISVGRHP